MARHSPAESRPGARFIDPRVLARIDRIDLVARTVVEGFIGGLHRSPYRGLSVDFAEHRQYMPGDDIRLIDWKVYGRTDRFYIKQFEADSNTNFTILLDMSRSMAFGQAGIPKIDYARLLTASLAYFAGKQRDRIGLVTFNEDVVDYIPPSAKHLDLVLHTLDRLRPDGGSALGRPLWRVADAQRRRGIVLLISDLYEPPEEALRAVERLSYQGHDVVVFHLLDRAEIDFDFDEAANYVDMETGRGVPVLPDRLRDRYREMVADHIDALRKMCGPRRIDYELFDTSQPLDHALHAYLAMRHRLARVR